MFCYQCEQTAGGTGCSKGGVCGKSQETALLQDLLIHQLKGIGYLGSELQQQGKETRQYDQFVIDGLFATLTNVNFDSDRFASMLQEAQRIKDDMAAVAGGGKDVPIAVSYQLPGSKDEMLADALTVGVMADPDLDADIRSVRETMIYGLKGTAAYAHHAQVLGRSDQGVNEFMYRGLAAVTDDDLGIEQLLGLIMELGQVNLRCMEILDEANTGTYGHPQPTTVVTSKRRGPFIIVSGHDLKDLQQLLEQTEGTGVNVYTHGEMLPAHGYPELKRYPHLVGNYGGAWQNQRQEFDGVPGCIVMTTNCIQKPKPSYEDRIFTTGPVGWPGIAYVPEVDGKKDFREVIDKALSLGGWEQDEEETTVMTGFGHQAVLSHAGTIVDAVKAGKISGFYLVGGCDGSRASRSYYSEFAERAPEDSVILTLGCGKYRFNHKDLGTVAGLPRLLDMGQCNDAFSAIKVAGALAEAFECDVNDLPLTLVLSWYEQKAVSVLLTLLSLGIKRIYVGPTLPAFISPGVLQVLVDTFEVRPVSTVAEDLAVITG